MAKSDVLARVAADLARGHTHTALQRLATLTANYPDDLEIRAYRATVHRQVGDLIEAGRWGFLTEEATPAEIAAFERAQRAEWTRLRVLGLRSDPTSRLGPVARQRFAELTRRASAEASAPVIWTSAGPVIRPTASRWDDVPCMVVAVLGVLVLGLAIIGLLTVVKFVTS
ncbi:DUF6584 family protein [Dactylosporangium salmoneum]|uniref:Uncharacterized protein n=1 Tax=Dactylosporangium salmoneum TaxID=53361 RepID=A0ABN3I0I5_9ACTN